jgi:hypothetical protein
MDDKRFDELSQVLSNGATRRTLGRLISGGALVGVASWLGVTENGGAKRKKRKKKNKDTQRCPSSLPTSCPGTAANPQGVCAPPGFSCCSSALGGGACDPSNPQCCAPTVQDSAGLCIPNGSVCCTSNEGGGFCDPGETCCPPCPGWPNGLCASPGYPCWMSCKSGLTGGVSEGFSEQKNDASKRSKGDR